MNNLSKPLPRLLQATLQEALRWIPVVVLTGARQTGKSTFIQRLLDPHREYHTLDDMDVLEKAKLDDVKGIQKFLKEYGQAVPHGLILHNGSKCEEIADRIWAVPLAFALGL
jgi:predicted AAA+ superfamily ATPase